LKTGLRAGFFSSGKSGSEPDFLSRTSGSDPDFQASMKTAAGNKKPAARAGFLLG
jgi:hypothetical protein